MSEPKYKRVLLKISGEAQTDEGMQAPNICFAVSMVLPSPHPALRATFPQGKAFGLRYEQSPKAAGRRLLS